MSEDKPINLNLGGWTDTKPGYITVDIREGPSVDLVADARDLSRHFRLGTVDNIIAFELLEHYVLSEGRRMLVHWVELLKAGGKLHLRVPDLGEVFRQYLGCEISYGEALRHIYGWQENDLDFHRCFYDAGILREILEELDMKVEQIQYVPKTRMLYVDAVKSESITAQDEKSN